MISIHSSLKELKLKLNTFVALGNWWWWNLFYSYKPHHITHQQYTKYLHTKSIWYLCDCNKILDDVINCCPQSVNCIGKIYWSLYIIEVYNLNAPVFDWWMNCSKYTQMKFKWNGIYDMNAYVQDFWFQFFMKMLYACRSFGFSSIHVQYHKLSFTN